MPLHYLDGHVELQGVGEEDGHREHKDDDLGQPEGRKGKLSSALLLCLIEAHSVHQIDGLSRPSVVRLEGLMLHVVHM